MWSPAALVLLIALSTAAPARGLDPSGAGAVAALGGPTRAEQAGPRLQRRILQGKRLLSLWLESVIKSTAKWLSPPNCRMRGGGGEGDKWRK